MFESNDTFVEDAVKVVETAADTAKRTGLIAITMSLLCATVVLTGTLKLIVTILLIINGILTIIVVTNKNIEYEYDYTNGSLEIAKIIDNSKRKTILNIEPSEVKLVAAVGTNDALRYDHVKLKKYDCSAHNPDEKDYILVGHSEAKGDDFKVIFTPSEKLLNAMSKYNKNELYIN